MELAASPVDALDPPAAPPAPWIAPADVLAVRATYLARRLDTRASAKARRSARHPVVRKIGDGLAVLFPYGVVVTVGLDAVAERALIHDLAAHLAEPLDARATDDVLVRVAPEQKTEGLDEHGDLWLSVLGEERLAVVADVLAKSTVLDHFEQSIGRVVDELSPLAAEMERRGRTTRRGRELVRLIGQAHRVRQETVWRVEVDQKPDLVWDRPDLDALWVRLAGEYELGERHRALGRKVELLSESASTLLSLLHDERSLRVEWYIVALIVFEIALSLFQKLGP